MLNNDCGWKDGDSGYSAARNLLTQTGLLMEGVITQNPGLRSMSDKRFIDNHESPVAAYALFRHYRGRLTNSQAMME